MIRRIVVVALICAGLAAAGVVDAAEDGPAATRLATVGEALPVVGRPGTPPVWFCPTLRTSEVTDAEGTITGAAVEGTLLLSNPAAEPAIAEVSVVSAALPAEAVEVEVPPLGLVELAAEDLGDDVGLAAVVEVDSAQVIVARELTSELGRDIAPCLDRIESDWFVSTGATTADAELLHVVFDPLSEDAVIDLQVVSEAESGLVAGAALDGVVVPAGRSRALDVGELVRRRERVSARLEVRSGRVAVDRVLTRDGSDGRRGLSVAPAARLAAPTWYLPGGRLELGVVEELVVHNPSERPAEIDIEVHADGLDVLPQQRTVAPHDALVVPIDEATFGLPDGVDHSLVVTTLTDTDVVAELAARSVADVEVADGTVIAGGDDAGPGTTSLSTRWIAPLATNTAEGATTIVMHNPGATAADARVIRFGDGRRVQVAEQEIPPASERRVDVSTMSIERASVEVISDVPIAVGAGGPGPVPLSTAWTMAVPVDVR